MGLVEKIQDLCSSKETTLIGLEREIGLGRGTIRKWNQYSPSIDKLQKVAEYFKVSTDYLLYGFDRENFALYVNYARHKRSIKEFSVDTGIDEHYLTRICSGVEYQQPPFEIVDKIASNNQNDWVIGRASLYKTAGYIEEAKNLNTLNQAIKNLQNSPSQVNLNINVIPDNQMILSEDLEINLVARFRNLSPFAQQTILDLMTNLENMDKSKTEQSSTKEVG